ncbi:MAG: FecR family protein [Gammaproteobacteria bacterium]|nr:FecR family protein [Gammaproteobacteria bacterium]
MYSLKHYLILALALVFSAGSFASSGKILFTYGKVEIKHPDGQLTTAQKDFALVSGDTIITSYNGRVQLMMNDEAIFDLKPNTEFLIEEFSYAEPKMVRVIQTENKSFYRLMRGGFRTISGLIGKRNKKNYRITTPVATIGIRGTDYQAELCETDCPNQAAGLYVSVSQGGVSLANPAGILELDAGGIGFVSATGGSPVQTGEKPSASSKPSPASAYIAKTARLADGSQVNLDNGVDLPTLQPSGRGLIVANGLSNLIETSGEEGLELEFDENAELQAINFDSLGVSRGTARVVNSGSDANTGLYWGRWAEGSAEVSGANESPTLDLSSSNAHWVYSDNTVAPVVPLSGTVNFRLIANTNPSDNFGNRGTLGSATLSADFTNQTVDADIQLEINQETWDANASDVALDGSAATFAGDFDSVVITDQDNNASTGSGSLEGFFSGDESGDITGAGLGYSLSDDDDTTVEGVIAYEVRPEP